MNKKDKYQEALMRMMKLCASRELCRSEVATKLEKWELNETEINKILDTLERDRFIDEERYASAFAREKFRYNKWGKIKISYMLRMKGINDDNIHKALESIDNDEYLEMLKKILENQKKNLKAVNKFELKGKLARFAASKGFENHLIYELLNNVD